MSFSALDVGDEIYVSYGRHSNDFLLVECKVPMDRIKAWELTLKEIDGFMLDSNRWDCTPVDHVLKNYLLDTPAEEQLQRAGYLGFVCFLDRVVIASKLTR